MSEYQYYEFQAIDRPLTAKEMAEIRSHSTRARITPTSFVNDYSWGSFKANVDAWMETYFDAFLHLTNWGTRVLKLGLPARILDAKAARSYCSGERVSVREKNGKVILTFVAENEDGGDWVEGAGQLASLIPARAELGRGDLRALYLGWLLCAESGDLNEDEVEPPVPAGLNELSAGLESFTEFLRIDSDLVRVAAAASPPLVDSETKSEDVRTWLARLGVDEKDDILARVIAGETALDGELIQRMAAKRKHRQAREAAAARKQHLDRLAGTEPLLWQRVGELVATKQPKRYDDAVAALIDLRDLAERTGGADFSHRLEVLLAEHARKPALIDRLHQAGL